MSLDFKDQDAVRQEKENEQIENTMVMLLCNKNGWEAGSEDYGIAEEEVKWFIENYNRIKEEVTG